MRKCYNFRIILHLREETLKFKKLWLVMMLCIVLVCTMMAFVACKDPAPVDPVTVTSVHPREPGSGGSWRGWG